ncbi:MAG: hypothetical protein B6I24_05555 [Bacteroidetes bacterium 4572_128]|nr:MAG: hypothetical protein B6I24_05555 [Bacteroidetes bacterium 4572_128]
MAKEKKTSKKRLKLSNFKLKSLLRVTEAINDNLPTKKLLKLYQDILKIDLNIGKIVLYSYNKEWNNILYTGIEKNIINKIDIKKDLQIYKDLGKRYYMPKNSILEKYFDFVIPVFHQKSPIACVLIGDLESEQYELAMSPVIKHLKFIQTITNIIVVSIENKRLHQENLRQEIFKKEIELSSKMQTLLIPDADNLPKNDKINTVGFYFPHYEVGGDYYDVFELNKNELGFCIADVSGKGFSAALLMSNFQANLRALFKENIDLKELIFKLNRLVLKNANNEKFITFFVGRFNLKKSELTYINSAHIPPILYNKKSKKITYLDKGCVGLGMLDNIPFINENMLKIEKKSKLICYTDGLSEIENEKQEEIGSLIVEKNIKKNIDIEKTINSIIKELKINKTNNKIVDDVTILGIEFL